jgi:hypothetical protein
MADRSLEITIEIVAIEKHAMMLRPGAAPWAAARPTPDYRHLVLLGKLQPRPPSAPPRACRPSPSIDPYVRRPRHSPTAPNDGYADLAVMPTLPSGRLPRKGFRGGELGIIRASRALISVV